MSTAGSARRSAGTARTSATRCCGYSADRSARRRMTANQRSKRGSSWSGRWSRCRAHANACANAATRSASRAPARGPAPRAPGTRLGAVRTTGRPARGRSPPRGSGRSRSARRRGVRRTSRPSRGRAARRRGRRRSPGGDRRAGRSRESPSPRARPTARRSAARRHGAPRSRPGRAEARARAGRRSARGTSRRAGLGRRRRGGPGVRGLAALELGVAREQLEPRLGRIAVCTERRPRIRASAASCAPRRGPAPRRRGRPARGEPGRHARLEHLHGAARLEPHDTAGDRHAQHLRPGPVVGQLDRPVGSTWSRIQCSAATRSTGAP